MKILNCIKSTFKMLVGFFKSIRILLFNSIKRPAIFSGYCHEWFCRQYRVKRELYWHRKWNQAGREQFILPFLPGKLIVCSKLELEAYRKKGLVNNNISIRKLVKRSI
jgi:hypothetical protein